MATTERQVIVLGKDGDRVEFYSPRCRIVDNDDGSLTLTDLCAGPPPWVRSAEANVELMGNQ